MNDTKQESFTPAHQPADSGEKCELCGHAKHTNRVCKVGGGFDLICTCIEPEWPSKTTKEQWNKRNEHSPDSSDAKPADLRSSRRKTSEAMTLEEAKERLLNLSPYSGTAAFDRAWSVILTALQAKAIAADRLKRAEAPDDLKQKAREWIKRNPWNEELADDMALFGAELIDEFVERVKDDLITYTQTKHSEEDILGSLASVAEEMKRK